MVNATAARRCRAVSRPPARGVTYLWVLFSVALIGISLAAAAELWVSVARQHRSEQMAWVGEQFRVAIGSYYEGGPGGVKAYPNRFEDLLEDRRFGVPRRHLRQLYLNPFNGLRHWEVAPCAGPGICGVRAVDAEGAEFIVVYEPAVR